jgi:hypothetical protein
LSTIFMFFCPFFLVVFRFPFSCSRIPSSNLLFCQSGENCIEEENNKDKIEIGNSNVNIGN